MSFKESLQGRLRDLDTHIGHRNYQESGQMYIQLSDVRIQKAKANSMIVGASTVVGEVPQGTVMVPVLFFNTNKNTGVDTKEQLYIMFSCNFISCFPGTIMFSC